MELLEIKRFLLNPEQIVEINSLLELTAKGEKPGLVLAQMLGVSEGVVFASCVYFPHEPAKKIQQIFNEYAEGVSKE